MPSGVRDSWNPFTFLKTPPSRLPDDQATSQIISSILITYLNEFIIIFLQIGLLLTANAKYSKSQPKVAAQKT